MEDSLNILEYVLSVDGGGKIPNHINVIYTERGEKNTENIPSSYIYIWCIRNKKLTLYNNPVSFEIWINNFIGFNDLYELLQTYKKEKDASY